MKLLRRNRRLLKAHWRHLTRGDDKSDTWTLMFPEHRIAYVPIPKAANSSIRSALLPLLGIEPSSVANIQSFEGFDKRRFSRCLPELDENWFVFTVVRNPFARVASAYRNKVVERSEMFPPFRGMGMYPDDDFRTFVTAISRWPRPMLNDHVMPQTMLLAGALRIPNFSIYKVEELPSVWGDVCRHVRARSGINLGELESRNASTTGWSWQDAYDEQTATIVRKVYAQDLARFGYPPSWRNRNER